MRDLTSAARIATNVRGVGRYGLPVNLAYRREKLGLAEYQIAERLGVAVGTLTRWEAGENEPMGAVP
jgi:ribosome-binding protein aMBF1 (putative translation factor)